MDKGDVRIIDELRAENGRLSAQNDLYKSAIARMSHEIRTPMNAVLGMTQMAKKSGNPEEVGAMLETVLDASRQMVDVINALLDRVGARREQAEPRQTRQPAGAEAPGKAVFYGKRILVVDDVDINREIVILFLEDTGVRIEQATNGVEAVRKVLASEKGYYDLVLMDVQMPDMDGCDATARIRRSGHPDAGTLPIYAMTAHVLREDVDKAMASGMNGHLSKPLELDTLMSTLQGVFSR